MLNKDSFYSKGFVISIRHHEMLTLGGTPCREEKVMMIKNDGNKNTMERNIR
jgi:hypothetical protein